MIYLLKMEVDMKNKTILLFIICCLFLCASCSSFKFSPETEVYRDEYLTAVEKATKYDHGEIKVTTVSVDDVIEFKTTESIINYNYTVKNGNVSFVREDYVNGTLNSKIESDGESVKQFDLTSEEWIEKTEENALFLSADKNPFTTLSLFRVDNNKKIKTSYLSEINKKKDGESTIIEFVLNDKAVSTVLGYTKADGIVRNSAGHTRSYYISSDGDITKIVIESYQDVLNNGKEGKYTSIMTVDIKR